METSCKLKYKALIANLNSFIDKDNVSLDMAKGIESLLDDVFPESEVVEDFIGELSFYSPYGGDHLCSFEEILPKIKTILNWVKDNAPS
jgi:hypothetical protein